MQRLSRTVFRNSAFGLVSQIAIKVLSFAFSVLIVRNLGAEAFGQYAAVGAFGWLFIFLSDLGLSVYAVREVARHRDEPDSREQANRLYANIITLRIVLAFGSAALMLVAAWLTQRPWIMIGAIALNSISFVLYAVQGTTEAMLSGYERLDVAAKAKIAQQVAFIALGGAALWAGLGYYGLILANLIAITLLLIQCWRGARALDLTPSRPSLSSWPALLRLSFSFGIIGFTLGLSYKFDSVLLNLTRSDAETGYYNAAYNLIFSTVVFSNVLNTALYPSLSRASVTAPQSLPRIYERILRYLMVLALPIAVGIAVLADQIVLTLFKEGYQPAVPALRILALVVPFMYASEFLGYVVVISGNERRVARSVAISTFLNVSINLLMIPRFGYIGAAVMTVLTEVVLVSQYVWILRDQLKQLDWGRFLLRPLLASAVMGGVLLVFHALPLWLSIVLGAAVYAGMVLAMRVLGVEEARFMLNLRRST